MSSQTFSEMCDEAAVRLYLQQSGIDEDFLAHHGVKGQKWGVRLGPPYPLSKQATAVKNLVNDIKQIKYKEFTKLMSPQEVAQSKSGSCHDQVFYEYDYLKQNGLDPKAHFFIELDGKGHGGQTHSIIYFLLNDKYYWLENAWGDQKGLHDYPSKDQLIADVLDRWDKSAEYPDIYDGNMDCEKLHPGMSLQEIIDDAVD